MIPVRELRRATSAVMFAGIVLLISTLNPIPAAHDSTTSTMDVHESYVWTYKGEQFEWSVNIPMSLYDSYKAVPLDVRLQGRFDGFFLTEEDKIVERIANAFKNEAAEQGYNLYDRIGLLLAWIQNLPYLSDTVTTKFSEYPKFPVETLVDNGGDCKDTTYLFMSVLRVWGVDVVFVNPPGHLAAGVRGFSESFSGYSYTYGGGTYYYAETAAIGYQIGDIPDSYRSATVNIYPVAVEGYRPFRTTVPTGNNSTSPTDNGAGTDPTNNGQVQKIGPAPVPPISFPIVLLLAEFSAAGFAFVVWLETKTRRE